MTTSGQSPQARRIGSYEVIREIGRGGMGVVYLADQPNLGRSVALKQLWGRFAGDAESAARFLSESRMTGSLSHPNIVTVFDYFEDDGSPCIAMEYIARGSLRPHVGRLTLAQTAGVAEGVLAGLAHAHTHTIVHRDLKPENIMVTDDGRVKITDFGIAKATEGATERMFETATGMTVGTPAYMAPEQAMGREIGPWTDLYSLGVMLYEQVVGHVPFHETTTPTAILLRHVNDPIPPASQLQPSVDAALSGWIDRLLIKDPATRTRDATAAWESLEEIVVGVLGPLWRRHARISSADETRVTPPPLTPASFENTAGEIRVTPPPLMPPPLESNAGETRVTPAAATWVTRGRVDSEQIESVTDEGPTGPSPIRAPAPAPTPTPASSPALPPPPPPPAPAAQPAPPTPQVPWFAKAAQSPATPPVGPPPDPPPATPPVRPTTPPRPPVASPPPVPSPTPARLPDRPFATPTPPPLPSEPFVAAPAPPPASDPPFAVPGPQRGPDTSRHRSTSLSGWRLPVATVIAVVAIIIAIAVIAGLVADLVSSKPTTAKVDAPIAVGRGPNAIAIGDRTVWVANAGVGTVSRIDRSRSAVIRSIKIGSTASGIAVSDDSVWVSNRAAGSVTCLDRADGTVRGVPIKVGMSANSVAVGGGSVWITNVKENSVIRLDPNSRKYVSIGVGAYPIGVAVSDGDVWVANRDDGSVSRIDIDSGKVTDTIDGVGREPIGVAVGASGVWVSNYADDTVRRIDPRSGALDAEAIGVGDGPQGIAADSSGVWVANNRDSSVSRITPASGRERRIAVGPHPLNVATADGQVWVTIDGGRVVRVKPRQ